MPACVKVKLLRSADSSGIWGLYSAFLEQPELLFDQNWAQPSPKHQVKTGVWNAPRQVLSVLPAALTPWWMSGNIPLFLLLRIQDLAWVYIRIKVRAKRDPAELHPLQPGLGEQSHHSRAVLSQGKFKKSISWRVWMEFDFPNQL